MTTGYQPSFDTDVEYGEDGETIARDVLRWTFDRSVKVETKRKRRLDDYLYVELQHNPRGAGWRDSGLNVTKADLWAYVVGDSGIVLYFPTDLLRWVIFRTDDGKPCAETDGDCPTEGRLLRVSRLIQQAENWRGD